jgi:hypothetical protein
MGTQSCNGVVVVVVVVATESKEYVLFSLEKSRACGVEYLGYPSNWVEWMCVSHSICFYSWQEQSLCGRGVVPGNSPREKE